MNPLKSITGTIVTGVVISVIMMIVFSSGNGNPVELTVWFHVLAGVAWIGLLYYFNFVQVPGVAKALSEADGGGPGPAAINKYLAPTALLWFRWAAVATWLSGAAILAKLGILGAAFTFQRVLHHTNISINRAMPSTWLAGSVIDWTRPYRHFGGMLYPSLLFSNCLMGILLLSRFGESWFYRSWNRSLQQSAYAAMRHGDRETASESQVARDYPKASWLRWLIGRPVAAVARKDFLTFVREPAQWVQFSLVFGLLHVGKPLRHMWPWTVWAIVMGFIFGALHAATGELIGPLLAHVAINFFNREVLGRKINLRVPTKRSHRLPEPLSRNEVARLIDAAGNLKHRVLMMTTYSAGLRRSEVVRLKPRDIHSDRMLMGHSNLKTTVNYLHVTQKHLEGTQSPLDLLRLPEMDDKLE